MYIILFFSILFINIAAAADSSISTIAFGSCNHQNKAQPLWEVIEKNKPELWIWLGDVIYADTTNPKTMQNKYNLQLENKAYQAFLKTLPNPIIGTWDDHDYGQNNAGKEYPMKDISQQLFLDFVNFPKEHPLRQQKGIYQSYSYGSSGKKIKIILLDTRYHRDQPDKDGDILGETQWEWLEQELTNSDAQLHIIVSSIQVIPTNHPFEKWNNFPKARAKLFELLTTIPGVILISGDRHISELHHITNAKLNYPIYELTSSGLTHSWKNYFGKPSNNQIGETYTDLNFGLIKIDWDKKQITLATKGVDNISHIQKTIDFQEIGL